MAVDLTPAQKTTLKANMQANTNTAIRPDGVQFVINTRLNTGNPDDELAIANWYNQQASPNFFGNYSGVPILDIFNAITWKNFTPLDAVPTDTALNVAIWNARNAMCQTLQMNLQNLIFGRTSIDATKGKIVSAFQDTLSSVPSGTGGTSKDAGWAAVQKILCRKANNLEQLFADTSGGNGSSNTTAATLVIEGTISQPQVDDVLLNG